MCYIPEMAFLGGSIGMGEWVILFVVVLVVVGPNRLPEVARKFGRTMEMFRKAADEFKEQLMSMDKDIKDTVEHAAGDVNFNTEGEESNDESYGKSYEYDEGAYDDAGYPGNEDVVAEWEAESNADSGDVAENLETPDQVAENLETPDQVADSVEIADVAKTIPQEPAADSANGEISSTGERA